MADKIFYTEDELIEIYNECLDSQEGLNDDIEESPFYAGEEPDSDSFEDIEFDSYIVEYDDEDEEIRITLINVESEDYDGEDVTMVSDVEEDEDGETIYTPFEFDDD